MAAVDPNFVGVQPGRFYLQESSGFEENDRGGFDTGARIYLTHPKTPRASYPKIGAQDQTFPFMRVCGGIRQRLLECTLIELTVPYKGVLDSEKGHKLTFDTDTQIVRASRITPSRATFVMPVPMPTCIREYVTNTQPTLAGVGQPADEDFLINPPAWAIGITLGGETPPTLNLYVEWVLSKRTWEELGMATWLVTERYTYYYPLAE